MLAPEDIFWTCVAGFAFFGALGLAIALYERAVTRRDEAIAEHKARIEREGYVRYAEARKAGKLDILA
jgi:hypothetical protein